MAAPKPASPPRAAALTPSHAPPALAIRTCAQLPSARKRAPRPTTATTAILPTVSHEATAPLSETAPQLIAVVTAIAVSATTWSGPKGTVAPNTGTVTYAPSSAPPENIEKDREPDGEGGLEAVRAMLTCVQPKEPHRRPKASRMKM